MGSIDLCATKQRLSGRIMSIRPINNVFMHKNLIRPINNVFMHKNLNILSHQPPILGHFDQILSFLGQKTDFRLF